MARIPTLLVTDAKDVYDHIIAANPSAGLKDLRAGADLIIIKEALERTSTTPRWAPDVLQLGDVFTKDKASAQDVFRGTWLAGTYQLHSVEDGLAMKAKAREERTKRGEERARQAKEKDRKAKWAAATRKAEKNGSSSRGAETEKKASKVGSST